MAIPILKSSDMDRTLAFFAGKLGARLVWRERSGNPSYAGVCFGSSLRG